jgi:hypothetical protein
MHVRDEFNKSGQEDFPAIPYVNRGYRGHTLFWMGCEARLNDCPATVRTSRWILGNFKEDECVPLRYPETATAIGRKVTVLPVTLSHRAINEKLGLEGEYTLRVKSFLSSLGLKLD